jgi:hypothetical protein
MTSKKKDRKYNSIRHGVFAQILLSGNHFGEERENYVALISMLRSSIQPENGFEDSLVEKLAFLFLRLIRVYRADIKIAPKMFKRVSELLGRGQPSIKMKWISPEDQVVVMQRDPSSESLMRYESNLERQIGRTMDELERFRRMRRDRVVPELPTAEAEAPETKRETDD